MLNKIAIIIYTLIVVLGFNNLIAQRIAVFDTDYSEFTRIKASLYVFGSDGRQLSDLDTSQLRVHENGFERWNKKITCPPPVNPKAISSVLTIDVSHSMKDYGRMTLAKRAAIAWINAMYNPQSECALTSFDAFTYINHQFSKDKNSLINAVNQLEPRSGTNYQAAFLGVSGAIPLASKGTNKRIIVFLTDGEPDESYPPNPIEIINEARKNNITIYCIALGMNTSSILQMLADSTGGQCFGNINSSSQAELTYLMILQNIEGMSPCELEWDSDLSCGRYRGVQVSMPEYYIEASSSYYLPANYLPYLEITASNNFDFAKVDSGDSRKTNLRITAKLKDLYISEIKGDNQFFTINNNITGILNLAENETIEFEIEFSPQDTCRQPCHFTLLSDACSGKDFTFYGGTVCYEIPDTNDPLPSLPLKVVRPNGNETYYAGTDTLIKWQGIFPEEIVQIEFSADNGATWNLLTDTASHYEYLWKVPNISSKDCLMKIGNKDENNKKLDSVTIFGLGELTAADFSRDGKFAVSRSKNGYLIIWDVQKNEVIKKYENEFRYTNIVAWSSKNKVALGGKSNNVRVYDIDNNTIAEIETELDGNLTSISWNPDGNRLACGDNRGKIAILNTQYQYVTHILKEYSSVVQSISWDPTGFNLVSGHGDGAVLIWDLTSGQPILKPLGFHSGLASAVSWSPFGGYIASGGVDHRIIIHDTSGSVIKSLTAHTGRISSLDWNRAGTQLISGSNDYMIKKWTNQLNLIETYNFHLNNILKVKWNNDGTQFYSAAADNNIYNINAVTNSIIKSLNGHTGQLVSISWSPNIPSNVATAGIDRKIHIWDIRKGKVLMTFRNNLPNITCMSYNKQGSRIAAGFSDGTINIYNTVTGGLIHTLSGADGHTQQINSLDWSPDGIYLTSGGGDSLIKIWETSASSLKTNLTGHKGSVLSVDWSPDGKYIASGSEDKTANIWNANTWKIEKTLYDFEYSIISINWNSDGDSLVAGSSDGTIIIYNTIIPQQAKLAIKFPEKSPPSLLKWNPANNVITSSGKTEGALLWNTDYGFIMMKYPLQVSGTVYEATVTEWDKTGYKLIAGSDAGTLHVFHMKAMPSLIQSDVSDSLWSIVVPHVISRDVDMGSVKIGYDTTKSVYGFLANISKAPVRIDSIKISGTDIINFDMNIPPAPGYMEPFEFNSATMTFHPESIGQKSCTYTIYTQNDTLVHTISGLGVQVNIETYEIDFGEVEIGSSKDSNCILIKNSGNIIIPVSEIIKSGQNPDDFNIDSQYYQPFDLEPNIEYTVTATFSPSVSGDLSCTVEYYLEDDAYPSTAILKGKGIRVKPYINTLANDSLILICDESITDTITIENQGREQLIISSVTFTQNDNQAFSQINYTEAPPLDSAQQYSIILKFEPQAPGEYNVAIRITNNSLNNPEQEIIITGIKRNISVEITPKEKYLGSVCPGEKATDIFSITNSGSVENEYEIISIDDNISLSASTISLNPGESDIIEFEITAPDNIDTLSQLIYIIDKICGRKDSIWIHLYVVKPELYATNVTINSYPGSFADGIARLTNFSENEIVIDSIVKPEDSPFEIISDVSDLIVEANNSIDISIRYYADDTLSKTTTFILYAQPCEIVKFISVTGIIRSIPLTFYTDTISVNSGDRFEIPIRFNNEINAVIPDSASFRIRLCFNKNLLYPLSGDLGYIKNENRCIWLDLPALPVESNILRNVAFKAMLGNEDSTILNLDSAYSLSGLISLSSKPGMFILNNVCRQGRDRLVISTSELYLLQNQPNPAEKTTSIEFSLNEEGLTELILYNIFGEKVRMLDSGIRTIGKHSLNIDVSDIPNGTFFYVLRTPTNSLCKKMQIVK
ncbi:choice-of-anchor D domain-containing protein [Bacteroidota bacterium]